MCDYYLHDYLEEQQKQRQQQMVKKNLTEEEEKPILIEQTKKVKKLPDKAAIEEGEENKEPYFPLIQAA